MARNAWADIPWCPGSEGLNGSNGSVLNLE